MIYYKNAQSGFTLVETFVAITILLIVIVGPLSISSSTARSTSFSSEQVVAFFLAQEGIEIVQKARDDLLIRKFVSPTTHINYLADPWTQFTDEGSGSRYDVCFSTNGCGLELNTDTRATLKTPKSCTVSSPCNLFLDDSVNSRSRYTYTSTVNNTGYSRVINMTNISPNEVLVESTVSWRTGGQRVFQNVVIETYLYDVYGN